MWPTTCCPFARPYLSLSTCCKAKQGIISDWVLLKCKKKNSKKCPRVCNFEQKTAWVLNLLIKLINKTGKGIKELHARGAGVLPDWHQKVSPESFSWFVCTKWSPSGKDEVDIQKTTTIQQTYLYRLDKKVSPWCGCAGHFPDWFAQIAGPRAKMRLRWSTDLFPTMNLPQASHNSGSFQPCNIHTYLFSINTRKHAII